MWPCNNREDLCLDIEEALRTRRRVPPRFLAKMLGKLSSAALIAPWGTFWGQRGVLHLFAAVIKDLEIVLVALSEPEWSPTWTHLIALMIPQTPTHEILSDALYGGMGGWSPKFQILWRILCPGLIAYGFSLKAINSENLPSDLYNPDEYISICSNSLVSLSISSLASKCCSPQHPSIGIHHGADC
jgi:hypothetical protein